MYILRDQRKFLVLLLTLVWIFIFSSYAEAFDVIRTASELEKALEDKKITDIWIMASLQGNFVIPKWVESIQGDSGKEIIITPTDLEKPVLKVEGGLYGTSDTLKINNLTIICQGKKDSVGIDLNSLTKQVNVENVIFKGKADNEKMISGIYPSNNTILRNCTFEGLTWGIYAMDIATYDIYVTNTSFQNVAQAFAANKANGKVSITDGKGEKLVYWVLLHRAGDIKVTIDQSSINKVPDAGFAHRYLEKQEFARRGEKAEVSKYIDDYNQRKNSLGNDPFIDTTYIQSFRKEKDSSTALLQLKRELQKELKEIDFSDSDLSDVQLHINRSATLYYLLAECLSDFDWKRGLKHFISKEQLQDQIVDQCLWSSDQLAILELSTPNIFWGNTDSMRTVFTKIDVSGVDRIFRENLHIFRDWLETLNEVEKLMEELRKNVESNVDDIEYAGDLKTVLQKIYDLQITASRLIRVAFFDIPMQTVFTVSYSKTAEAVKDNKGFFGSVSDRGKDRVIQFAREISPFYSVSQQLCILNSTNDLRMELLREWKTALKKDSDEEMKSYLATDADIMREAERIEKFYNSWR
jgi:hypothetical protein